MRLQALVLRSDGVNVIQGFAVFGQQAKHNIATGLNGVDLSDYLADRVESDFLAIPAARVAMCDLTASNVR